MLKAKLKSDRIMTAEFRDGILVDLRYVPERRFAALREKATKTKWVDHQVQKEVDDEKFYELCAKEMIAGWRGLTGRHLKELVDLEDYPYADEEEVPYTEQHAFVLLYHCAEFDVWCTKHCKALEEFVAVEEERRKNVSSPSPAPH
jgi:hypothetical protein